MTAETALTGRELDRALAEAMGWRYFPDPVGGVRSAHWQHRDGAWRDFVPPYSSWVDALIGGPEARLRAAGWVWTVGLSGGRENAVVAGWMAPHKPDETLLRYGNTEAEARARACLAALAALALREERS